MQRVSSGADTAVSCSLYDSIGLTGQRARTHNQALELELETYSTYIAYNRVSNEDSILKQ